MFLVLFMLPLIVQWEIVSDSIGFESISHYLCICRVLFVLPDEIDVKRMTETPRSPHWFRARRGQARVMRYVHKIHLNNWQRFVSHIY